LLIRPIKLVIVAILDWERWDRWCGFRREWREILDRVSLFVWDAQCASKKICVYGKGNETQR
jgi:hypothetical protein